MDLQKNFEGTQLLANKPEGTGDENEKRATEIGPVLEEILHSHWDHWGLNE